MIQRGLDICKQKRYALVLVLGNPAYYERFGFSHELARNIRSDYSHAGRAWMALELLPTALSQGLCQAEYAEPFALLR